MKGLGFYGFLHVMRLHLLQIRVGKNSDGALSMSTHCDQVHAT